MSCIVCSIVEPIERITEEYSRAVCEEIAPSVIDLFTHFIAIWVIYVIFKALCGELQMFYIIKQVLKFIFIISLLKNVSWIWDLFFSPIKLILANIVELIINEGTAEYYYIGDKKSYVNIIDCILQEIYNLGSSIGTSWNPLYIFSGLLIILIYCFLAIILVYSVIEYMFIVFIIYAFSPFLLVTFGFKTTRNCAVKAVKYLLGSVLTICFSILGMSFTVIIYNELLGEIGYNNSISGLTKWAWGKNWLKLVILGVISFLQQHKARVIAHDIMDFSFDTGVVGNINSVQNFEEFKKTDNDRKHDSKMTENH